MKFFRQTLLTIIFLLNILCLSAVKAQNDQNAVLWEISGNGLNASSYVFGIINFLPKDKFSVSKKVQDLMGECEIFATKTVVSKESRNAFNQAARIPNDGWINDYLTDDELNQLRLLMLLDLEVSENDYHFTYSRLQPIILVTAATLLYLDKNVVLVEDELAKAARKHKLKFVGLGTMESEIEAFGKFPIEDQVEAIKYTVGHFDEHIEDYNQLVKYYLEEQDLDKIQEEILKATNRSQVFQQVYYDDRQKNWVPVIKQLMTKDPTFIAVGAPHLPGNQGLLQLLKDEGYTLSPLNAFE